MGSEQDNRGRINRITSNQNTSVRTFAQNVGNRDPQGYALKPVLTKVGPDGSLYYLLTTYESNYGAVVRVSWKDGSGGQQQVARPVISPAGGSFNTTVKVSLSTSTSGAQIRYTLNDQEPTSTSRLYTGSFTVTTPKTIKAKAFKDGMEPSATARAVFTQGGGGGSPEAGLIAHWRLDEQGGKTASDAAGSYDDTFANGPSWRPSGGRLGGALAFDGVNDRVDVKGLEIGDQALTLALWFRADDFGQMDGRFISKATGTGDKDHFWMFSTMNKTELRFRLKAGGSVSILSTRPDVIRAGRWHHVAAVYDGATMRIYRDGTEVARRAKTGGISLGRGVAAALGNQPKEAGSRPFDGLLDDVRIYTRALSQSEISALATGQASPPPSSNQRPTALAGSDRSVPVGRTVTLDGSQSTDPDDDDLYLSWRWKQLSGPSVTLDSPEEALSTFVPRQSGTYAFRLTVRDRQGAEATDEVTIRVTDTQSQPSAPLWVERFDLLPEGMKRDNGKTAWRTETSQTKSETLFAVRDARFEAHATGGEGLWISEQINIAGAGPVKLSVDLRSAGDLNPDDYLRLHYKLDGKPGVLFAEQKGAFGTKTVRAADLRGSTLEVLIRAKTNARGERYQWDNVTVSTGTQRRLGEEELEAVTLALPTEHALGHAYPNPFNPSTEIPFELPEAGPVSLVVYDVMGREVARLVDGPLEAGYHGAMWEAGDLPSGVYLYRLTAGTFTATEQVTLVK